MREVFMNRSSRILRVSLVVFVLAFGLQLPGSASAATKALSGSVNGIELCPQFVCGAAYFAGSFSGSVGNIADTGYWTVSIQHDPLPNPGESAAISGGDWNLVTGANGTLSGRVSGGTLTNNGDGTFTVDLTLKFRGGYGSVGFLGTLSHNVFPPTITGTLG
jgi:hypothetical protein